MTVAGETGPSSFDLLGQCLYGQVPIITIDSSTIIAEINPPKVGLNRRVSGAFLKDALGRTYLAHRGRVGGGRKGIGKKAFMAWYRSDKEVVNDGGRYTEMIIIGALDDETLIEELAAFTYSVAAFKEQAVHSR